MIEMSSKLKYYEEIPQSTHSDSCSGLREELKACLLATDCVKVVRFYKNIFKLVKY